MAISSRPAPDSEESREKSNLVKNESNVDFGPQWELLICLAAVQFAHVLDFVIVMPLGPQLMRVFSIGPQKFSMLVSVYNLSAAATTLTGALWLDSFDRKKVLLWVFAGFAAGTTACAAAQDIATLSCARVVTGACGGILQALLFAIIGDRFSEAKRGAATGAVMSAFALASIAGIPASLWLAERLTWRIPFYALGAFSAITWLAAWRVLPSLGDHISNKSKNPVSETVGLFKLPNTYYAMALTISLMLSGFSVIPFLSAFLVRNLGLLERDLATVFLASGAFSLITSQLAGRLADRQGKSRTFTFLALASIIPTLALTNLKTPSTWLAIGVSTFFTVLIAARAVPALAMMTSCIHRSQRGRFLSLTSSVQQAASGAASLVGGGVLSLSSDGSIQGYPLDGLISTFGTLLAIGFANAFKPVNSETENAVLSKT